jgi:VIT1/CCC1 family predicted Fe2+/Mn2+ transporter
MDMARRVLACFPSDPKRALVSATTIAVAYIAGGFIPLAPYFIVAAASRALAVSVAFTLLALFMFGYVKGHFTGAGPIRSAVQKALVGGLAATAAFGIARAIA